MQLPNLRLIDRLSRERILHELREHGARQPIWRPLRGPQRMAYDSQADVIGFGGAAGGGKTDLAIGKALTQHQVVQIFRREGPELRGIIERMAGLLGNRTGLGGNPPVWRDPSGNCRLIEFLSVPNPGDETKYQGRPKDLLVFDEASNFLESQVRFLMGWVRTTDPNQKCQVLMTFNPPTTVEGRWIVDFFAPWLDDKHPNPAQPGELRYFGVIAGKDVEVDGPDPFVVIDGKPCYDFEPLDYQVEQIVVPKSRTFIPSRITDNPHLMAAGYIATLQALPEPLRSQMLYGDFKAGMSDDPWQVIPTAWVDAAMDRWRPLNPKPPMDSLGVDVARGGADKTVIGRRHGFWFDELIRYPGSETPDGPSVAGQSIAAVRNRAPIHIDVIGVGASPYDFLKQANQQVIGVNVSKATEDRDISGMLEFSNVRSMLWWRLREVLDPTNNTGVALPPDKALRRDLCTPKWRLQGRTIYVQSREEIVKELGRSPDDASAVILALVDTPNLHLLGREIEQTNGSESGRYDPRQLMGAGVNEQVGWNPLDGIRRGDRTR